MPNGCRSWELSVGSKWSLPGEVEVHCCTVLLPAIVGNLCKPPYIKHQTEARFLNQLHTATPGLLSVTPALA